MEPSDPVQLDAEGLRLLRDDAARLLTAVRRTLADLLERVVEGDGGALKEAAVKQAELENALKRVFEAEQKYHERIERERGTTGPDVIDFDAIRDQIGCRLHRLRTCCGPE